MDLNSYLSAKVINMTLGCWACNKETNNSKHAVLVRELYIKLAKRRKHYLDGLGGSLASDGEGEEELKSAKNLQY